MAKESRIMLGLSDFKGLIRGEIVDKETDGRTVSIALSDIGWDVMAKEIVTAASDAERRRKETSRARVAAFSPGQTTWHYPDGAPQRESYDSDRHYLEGVRKYEDEWRKMYRCAGCGDPVCPQCGRIKP